MILEPHELRTDLGDVLGQDLADLPAVSHPRQINAAVLDHAGECRANCGSTDERDVDLFDLGLELVVREIRKINQEDQAAIAVVADPEGVEARWVLDRRELETINELNWASEVK